SPGASSVIATVAVRLGGAGGNPSARSMRPAPMGPCQCALRLCSPASMQPRVYAGPGQCGPVFMRRVRGMPGRDVERASRIDRPYPHTEQHSTPFPAEALKSANFEVLDHRVGEQRLGDLLHLL